VEAGQHWQFKVRLKRPHGFQNPGGFDYEAWLWQRGIRAIGYIRQDTQNQLLQDAGFSIQQLRQRFRESIMKLVESHGLQRQGLLRALSIGERQGLSSQDWALFSATGTTHLMVISGMHLGIVCGCLLLCLSRLLACIPRLCLLMPAQALAACLCIPAVTLYAQIAGFGLPVQRAFVMCSVFLLGMALCRQHSAQDSYYLALLLVLLNNPLAGFNSGFWLSFAAVAILLFCMHQRRARPALSTLFLTQVVIAVALLPFMLLFFQQSSVLAPLVNIPAIPFISLLVVPLCLLSVLLSTFSEPATTTLLILADRLLDVFMLMLQQIQSNWPRTLLHLPAVPWWQWTFLVCVTLLALRQFRKGHYGMSIVTLLLSLAGFLPLKSEIPEGHIRLDILDVGQGLAVLVQTRTHTLLYDTGPLYSPDFDAGSGIILPFMRSQNISKLDRVIVSHGDLDHRGGLEMIQQAFPLAKYLTSKPESLNLSSLVRPCRAGTQWQWDGVDFQILHPDGRFYSDNNSSCVLLLSNGHFSVLLPGDIENQVERLLVSQQTHLQADILVAAHHGSRTSSGPAFVRAVSPQYVIFSSGYLNAFNHPHPQVVKLYTNSGTIGLNTTETGTLHWDLPNSGELPVPQRYREQKAGFWTRLQ